MLRQSGLRGRLCMCSCGERYLTGAAITQKWRLARHVAGAGLTRLKRVAATPFRELAALRSRLPEKLAWAPRDIRTTDPTLADDIYAGYFAFGGKIVNAHGRSPFEIEAAPSWERALAGFGWLRHLAAADTALARANAQALVDDFLTLRGRPSTGPMWETQVTARRMLSWLSQSPLLLQGVDQAFYRRFMAGLARGRAHLHRALADGPDGDARLTAAIALMQLALCAQSPPKESKRAVKALSDELARQILPDGGHISRNPQMLVDLLLDLLPLRQIFVASGLETPRPLIEAIDRITPILRAFRLDDGALGLFNGMGATAPDVIATLLAYDDPRGTALSNAPYSGYQRISAGAGLLLMDCGKAPPPAFSQRAHAGCLSFEYCYDRQKVIANCGAPDANREAAREAARATAAHSTLIIGDMSSCRFAAEGALRQLLQGQIVDGPHHVAVARRDEPRATRLTASHDGYVAAFGVAHQRSLRLSADGARLEGEDRLIAAEGPDAALKPAPYALRFHLHPAIEAQRVWDGAGVMLTLPDGAQMIFEARGLETELEESVAFAMPHGPTRALQIVVRGDIIGTPDVVWSLALHAAPPPESEAGQGEPEPGADQF